MREPYLYVHAAEPNDIQPSNDNFQGNINNQAVPEGGINNDRQFNRNNQSSITINEYVVTENNTTHVNVQENSLTNKKYIFYLGKSRC